MLSKRALNIKPSPTLALNAKAKELASQGRDVISLSVGEPDWDTFPDAKKAAINSIESGLTKYTPANGLVALRKAIAKQTENHLAMNYHPDCVTVAPGAKFILFSALQVLCDPGDEVIIPSPYWVSYPTMVELAGGIPVIPQCRVEDNFKLTPEVLERHITPSTKLLILNSPCNPTGAVYSRNELSELARILEKHPQVLVLSDDIYNQLVFGGEEFAPHLLEVAPQLKDRVVVINGVSKSYAMTGWRVGWALAKKEIIQAMTNYQSQSVSCLSHFAQDAAIAAITKTQNEVREAVKNLKSRRDLIVRRLQEIPGLKVKAPEGAFYCWPEIDAFFRKQMDGQSIADSQDFARLLLDDQNVAVVPGKEFGAEGFVRMSFVLAEPRMLEACERLSVFLNKLT